MRWLIKHKSGRVLFVTSDEFIADNRRKIGWIVEEVKMTSREQFEHECRNGLINGGLAKFDNGVYASELTMAVWDGWQASRAAIVVELPERQDSADCYCLVYPVDDVVFMLNEAGLKVKK